MWTMYKKILRHLSKILSVLFPYHCYLCKKENSSTSICLKCLDTLPLTIDSPSPFIFSIFSFKDVRIKKCIHAIKYFHRKDLLLPFANRIANEVRKEDYLSYVVVPIPMPLLRKYIRGYNQAEVLSTLLANELGIQMRSNLLHRKKIKHTHRQVTMRSRKDRLLNQKNTFISSELAKNMNIILIDDVTTTGATLREARKVLLASGASHVVAYTIAH